MIEQRKQFYIDQKLQGYLLAGLIILEIVFVCLLLFYLYDEINLIIEDRLYRIHSVDATSWPEIFTLLTVTMSSFVVINILALFLAHLIWGRYVKQTIILFSAGLDKIIALDFSDSLTSMQSHHRMIDLMEQWFEKEQKRNREVSIQIDCLSGYEGKVIEQKDRENLKQILDDYRRLLTHN